MRIGDYKQRAQVLNPDGYGYAAEYGTCFLSAKQTGRMGIFSHTAASLPQVEMEMWRRRDLTPESILHTEGAYYLVSDVQDDLSGKIKVYAVKMPLVRFSAEGAYIGRIEQLTAFVGEKYMAAPEDEFHAEEQETNIILTNKAVKLSLSDLLTKEDGTVWTVKRRFTSGPYRNEYEAVRYGGAE